MQPDEFWTSQDGQVLAVRPQGDDQPLSLTLAFWPRDNQEWTFWQEHYQSFK